MSIAGISPTAVRDRDDPGDETQRNFRYQHAYGVILLLASVQGKKNYIYLWCEHHEDFLAERSDGLYDAYQIKTAKPENGPWTWPKDALRDSIKRFVRLHNKFPGKIAAFFFVSNVEVLDSHAEDKAHQSPPRLLESLNNTPTGKLKVAFDDLLAHCQCTATELQHVLNNLHFIKGPDRDGFDAIIAHEHLSAVPECNPLTAAQRNQLRDKLVFKIYVASSLQVTDPSRHWLCIGDTTSLDPYIQSKKVTVDSVRLAIQESTTRPFSYIPSTTPLNLGKYKSNLPVLEQKMIKGGLADYITTMRRRTLSAEQNLIEQSHIAPERIEKSLNQIISVVQGICDDARLDASLNPEPYGKQMLAEVKNHLRTTAEQQPELVNQQPYDLLFGVAGLLTEDCTVWWSEHFALVVPTEVAAIETEESV